MRLISLVLALVFIVAIIIYYKNSGSIPTATNNNPLIKSQQAIDEAKRATDEMNKALENQKKQMQALEALEKN